MALAGMLRMKPLPKLVKREVITEAAESRNWHCSSCDKMIEDGIEGLYCRSCADYWKDVSTWRDQYD